MDQDQLASMLTNVINNAAADALSMQLEDIASDARKALKYFTYSHSIMLLKNC